MPIQRLVLALGAVALGSWPAQAAAPIVDKQAHGVLVRFDNETLRLEVWSDRVVRVTDAPGSEIPPIHSLSVISTPAGVRFEVKETPAAVVLMTRALRARVDKSTGLVSFRDPGGKVILDEKGSRESTAGNSFAIEPDEQIYGLGQHQNGYMSYRGTSVHLQQKNMEIGIPVLVSSRGYGLLWDNSAITDVEVGIKGKENALRWASETGKAIDYYFIYGPKADDVIAAYRTLTGPAPLMPKWLWGFWQCKERYATQAEMLGIVSRYRENHKPLDGIVQDWQYWKPGGWGSHEFDPERYPDPKGMVDSIHKMNAHILISVWARFDLDIANEKELETAGALYPPVVPNVYPKGEGKWYDALNPEGRRIYWKQIQEHLGVLGIDGWWLDATEPEIGGKWGEYRSIPTAAGPGATVFNAYPLMTTAGIYQGQRAGTDRKRVVILTRSAYAGQQRNSAISWSGDIKGTWEVFRKQIPAGLNFSISGVPYWNTDIGGFFGGDPKDPRYQELFVRWFQFGAFTPMFRVHGTGAGKEFWQFDQPTQKILDKFERLRYRLMPYIYSVSWQVTDQGSSMLRPLVMDFASDRNALTIADQYLFGPALMVNPVTEPGATSRGVYLPGKAVWYDFWTGNREEAGSRVDAAAQIESMPLFVPAGSILPLGPETEYVDQKPADPLEVRVYPGADGFFVLYEDAGDSYDYEHGGYTTIPFHWNDASRTLIIGKRNGAYEGMLKKRILRIVLVDQRHGGGVNESAEARAVAYSGKEIHVRLL
ncbi:MAG: glycoside hydrolase family 31 protein [Bryobacteraceae bacterium]|jgi:alpha-D-xyloside xylohydrolase